MSELLQIPKALKGNWNHLLILSYGADLPFFESALWREMSARCKNKVILADGYHYLNALESNASNRLARYLNQRYVFDGIFSPLSAHAKLILLTNNDAGRLLVGSGNLNMQGYASGGELFTQYEYSKDHSQALPAFLTARDLLESLISKRFISSTAIRHIHYMFENSPWLYYPSISDWQPVRHNLNQSFLEQLIEEIGSETVEELWIISPFYDERVIALKQTLEKLAPKAVTVLVQPGSTSVDKSALQNALETASVSWKVCSFNAAVERGDPYVHAKLYLVKTPSSAICLQGSPNLSQVAMLRAGPEANIELANLLLGDRNQFDSLLEGLYIHPATENLQDLDLSYQRPEPTFTKEADAFLLIGGNWLENELVLHFKGELPNLDEVVLFVNETIVPYKILKRHPSMLKLKISNQFADLLDAPAPVTLRWGKGDDAQTSNPVFVFNQRALDELLEITDVDVPLGEVGELNLDDEKMEELLRELDSQMVIDERSFWQIAGKKVLPTEDSDDDFRILSYDDIDYEALKHHPKLKQYQQGDGNGPGVVTERSPVQILLNSIVGHFNKLVDVQMGIEQIEAIIQGEELDEDISEEEREKQEKEKQRRNRSRSSRIRQIFKSFIRRYLRGIRSEAFQDVAGFDIMVKNYAIFSHILWRLFSKDWIEPEFILDSLLEMWSIYWGDRLKNGYFDLIDTDRKSQAIQFLCEHKSDSLFIAALFNCAFLTRTNAWEERRLTLRNYWRFMLEEQPFPLTDQTLEGAWVYLGSLFSYNPPTPTQIVQELSTLANHETLISFLRSVEQAFDYPKYSCQLKKVNIFREYLNRMVSVDCLVISCDYAVKDIDTAIAIMQMWKKYYPRLYYRIVSRDGQRLFIYDAEAGEGLFLNKPTLPDEFSSLPPAPISPWEKPLAQLEILARNVSKTLLVEPKLTTQKIQQKL